MATTANDLGSWHGPHEAYAKLYVNLCLAELFGFLVFPWVGPWLTLIHHPTLSYARLLRISPGWLVLIDLLGLTLAISMITIYRRLSAKIAEGAAESAFLDRIRVQMVTFTHAGFALLFLIAINIR
jgi:hypothetical protein